MATPKQTKSGKWTIQVYSHKEDGKRKYITFTAPTKVEVAKMAADFQADKAVDKRPQDITVGQALKRYIDKRSHVLSPSSIREYKSNLKYYKSIENIRIASLTCDNLQDLANELSIGRSAKTVKDIYTLLMSAIHVYSDRSFRNVTLPEVKPPKYHLPTDADINNLISKASPSLRLAILLASVGTLRRGEICALTYSDILHDFNALYVNKNMILGEEGWILRNNTKTPASTRRVEFPRHIIEMLGSGEPDELILKVVPSTITTEFDELRDSLGLKCRFHDLRHYAASILHAIGVPDAYIMERGGWGSDTVLKNVYRNALSDKRVQFTNKANDYFENNIELRKEG